MAKEADVTTVDILQQIAHTLASVQAQANSGTNVQDTLTQMTKTLSELAVRTRPENPEHSRVSAYNPRGLRDADRPQLKCEFWWVGYPETPETLTDEEIETLNTLVPGNFKVTKANGVTIPFVVTARLKNDGTYERLEVSFPCKGDQSTDHRGKIEYVREAMGDKVPSAADLLERVRRLEADLKTAHAVIAAA